MRRDFANLIPEKNSVVREWSTNASGMAVLHDIQTPPSFFLTASFAAGDKLVRAQKYIQIVEYPTNTVFGKNRYMGRERHHGECYEHRNSIATQNISGKPPEPNDPPWLRVALAEAGVTRKTRRGKQSADSGIQCVYNSRASFGQDPVGLFVCQLGFPAIANKGQP